MTNWKQTPGRLDLISGLQLKTRVLAMSGMQTPSVPLEKGNNLLQTIQASALAQPSSEARAGQLSRSSFAA